MNRQPYLATTWETESEAKWNPTIQSRMGNLHGDWFALRPFPGLSCQLRITRGASHSSRWPEPQTLSLALFSPVWGNSGLSGG